jgi:hypothetical protein
MLKGTLKNIADTIQEYNPYFDRYFYNATADEFGVSDGENRIFPADTYGDYFYLRLPDNVGLGNSNTAKINDCTVAVSVSTRIVLVACVRKADEDKLIINLVSTLATLPVRMTGAIYNKEQVVMQELSKVPEKNVDKALSTLKADYTIVCIKFDYVYDFAPYRLNCLPNPCTEC